MKIITLGTSHGDPTLTRFNSSTLLEVAGQHYMIDAGAPVNALMIRQHIRMESLRAVFITHMHEDHVGGLSGLVKSLVKYAVAGQHTDIFFSEQEAIDPFLGWMQAMHRTWAPELVSFGAAQPGAVYGDERVQVTAISTDHYANEGKSFPSYAYLFHAEGKRVLFTGDLRWDFADFPKEAMREAVDVCVCECTHFDLAVAQRLLASCKAKRMIFHHVGNEWHGEGEDDFRAIVQKLPFPCDIAHDGDCFDISL